MQLLLDAGSAVIADIFDSNGIAPPVLSESLFAIQEGTRFAGPAFTIQGASATFHGAGDREKLTAIDSMDQGVVPVWAGSDIQGVCCFGDLLGEAMKIRGCEGVVVDGGVRDVAYLRGLKLPVIARYRTPAQAIGRWKVTAYQVPVQVRGALTEWITVNPGDLVVADEDGVVIVPASDAESVAAEAARWAGAESEARDAIRHGMSLVAALDRYGHL